MVWVLLTGGTKVKITHHPDKGFGSFFRIDIGWLSISFMKYENHWDFQIMWAKPL